MQLLVGYTARTDCNWSVKEYCNCVNIGDHLLFILLHVFSRVHQELQALSEQKDLQ